MIFVQTRKAPDAVGPYSQGVITGNLLFTSGQIAINPNTQKIEGTTIQEQAHQVCQNISAICKAAGTDIKNVVKTTCYLANINDFEMFNTVYEKYFDEPARSCVAVANLPKYALCEIEAIVEIENKDIPKS